MAKKISDILRKREPLSPTEKREVKTTLSDLGKAPPKKQRAVLTLPKKGRK